MLCYNTFADSVHLLLSSYRGTGYTRIFNVIDSSMYRLLNEKSPPKPPNLVLMTLIERHQSPGHTPDYRTSYAPVLLQLSKMVLRGAEGVVI